MVGRRNEKPVVSQSWRGKRLDTETKKKRVRLKNEKFTRPNTKYVLDSYTSVDIKLGEGRFPEWLRTKKDLYTLDTVNYNFRVSLFAWQCIEERTKRII